MTAARSTVFVEQLSLENYKSVARCNVTFGPLTVVVGRNGSGKSNFLDALHFVADALETSLEYAIRLRGGAKAITHRLRGPQLRITITFRLSVSRVGKFELVLDRGLVRHEELSVSEGGNSEPLANYIRAGQRLSAYAEGKHLPALPKVLHDRLALVALSGVPEFRESYDALASMRFYRLNPEAMRALQDPDEGKFLRGDGSNLASVWARLQKDNPSAARRLTQYVVAVLPEITKIHRVALGPKETLHFHQATGPGKRDLMFHAASMSDGTLRALGALVASRSTNGAGNATVVGIEEPEAALHPGAVAALMDALHEASRTVQIVVTSHSPDVLDHVDVEHDGLLVTQMSQATTTVAPVDAASREAIRRHLYTPGELLRMDQLQPSEELLDR